MSNLIQKLVAKKLITPPSWLPMNVHYLTKMGSSAYGVADDDSDLDLYGFCFPLKDDVFPHLRGEIPGFGRQKKRFEQYQEHHIEDKESKKQYDITVYSIVKFFNLCMEANPNLVDALYTPHTCVLHITTIGTMVRENRDIFLSKLAWHKFKGYAYSQLSRIRNRDTSKISSKRKELIEKHGWDIKFGYHVVRLIGEVEQILETGTLDLMRNREQLKAIRRGEWTEEELREFFARKEKQLEELYAKSSLPHSPREGKIKQLLLDCLEHHYGSLDKCIVDQDKATTALRQIQDIANKALSD